MKNKIFVGDNLKIMQSDKFDAFRNRIKVIYIDPPYNTQTTKSYNDHVATEEWIKFMEPRLRESLNLLTDDGVIFISIDDNEYATLKILCDEIFGKENHLGTFITKQSQRSNAKHINTTHEYVIGFAKNKSKVKKFEIKRINIPEENSMINSINKEARKLTNKYSLEEANEKFKPIIRDYVSKYNLSWLRNYNNLDADGNVFFSVDLSTPGEPRKVNIPEIDLNLEPLPTRGWSSNQKFIELYENNRLVFKDKRPYEIKYLNEAKNNAQSILDFYSRQGTRDLKELGIQGLFDTPKPVELIKYLLRLSADNDDIVLDYFAGSGTTAQAVYEIIEEDHINLTYILIQLDEPINPKNKVYKKCQELNLEPSVDKILQYRLETYLIKKDLQFDFELIK